MHVVGTVFYLLVLSEGLETRRLHMVSPAAEPVVAFYMNHQQKSGFDHPLSIYISACARNLLLSTGICIHFGKPRLFKVASCMMSFTA